MGSKQSAVALLLVVMASCIRVDYNEKFKSKSENCLPGSKKEPAFEILHFNDVSDVMRSPFFAYEFLKRNTPQTLRLFSGDIFYPSYLSSILHGNQFINFLKRIKLHYSVVGNHELDNSEQNFIDLKNKLEMTWLLANLKRKGTETNFAEVKDTGSITLGGIKVCLMGLIDDNWMASLVNDPSIYDYQDFLTKARTLSKELRTSGCQLIIALTHMTGSSDAAFLNDPESDIDMILGGHHHEYKLNRKGNKILLKSGENFDHLSHIKIVKSATPFSKQTQNSDSDSNFDFKLKLTMKEVRSEKAQTFNFSLKQRDGEYFNISIEKVPIDYRNGPQDLALMYYNRAAFSKYYSPVSVPVIKIDTDVDVRSDTVSYGETPIGQFLADLMRIYFNSDITTVLMGTVRSETIFFAGRVLREYDILDMFSIPIDTKYSLLPFPYIKGLLELALPISLSGGDYFSFSGVTFNYNPTNSMSNLIDANSMRIAGNLIQPTSNYSIVIPKPSLAFLKLYPQLEGIPLMDPPIGQKTIIDAFRLFWELPRSNQNRNEFDVFKSQYPGISIDDLCNILNDPTPKVSDRLTGELIATAGLPNALKTISAEGIQRLKFYTLATRIAVEDGNYIFAISPVATERFKMVIS
jgi:2',3'-cyclic-nucleotide 2'-phosphodiesterase (5'-nucleotidase family)